MPPSIRRLADLAGGTVLLAAVAVCAGGHLASAQQKDAGAAPGRAPVTMPAATPAAPVSAALPATAADAVLVRQGEYLARAADCMPCHTRPGGTPWAGGLVMNTPFGQIASPNITADPKTGLGRWSEADFWNVLHNGVGPHLGDYIYPVMTYTSYTKLTRADVHAIWAYMRTIPPVDAPRLPVSLPFPFDIRPSLLGWQILFMDKGVYRPDAAKSPAWNRGAYLVEGAGHCGECHSPRNALGGVIDGRSLAGGVVDGYLAPNISSDTQFGIGAWSDDEIVAFLKHGDNPHNVVFGPMTDVVHESMAYMTDDDLHAIATYLKSTPARHLRLIGPVRNARASIARGASIYADNCAQCHQAGGHGVARAIPSLVANGALTQPVSDDIIMPVLIGQQGQGSYGAMPAFGGALDDRQIADLANYVRTAFGNTTDASTTAAAVRADRIQAPVGLGGSLAARRLGCAPIGESTVPGAAATEDEVTIASWAEHGREGDAIAALAARARADNPDATAADVARVVTAAYCPVVANAPGLDDGTRRDRLRAFAGRAGLAIAPLFPPSGSDVLMTASLPVATANAVADAAGAAHLPVGAFVARQIEQGAKVP